MRASGEHRALYPVAGFLRPVREVFDLQQLHPYFPPGTFQKDNATIGVRIANSAFQRQPARAADGADAEAAEGKETGRGRAQSGFGRNAQTATSRRATRGRSRSRTTGVSARAIGTGGCADPHSMPEPERSAIWSTPAAQASERYLAFSGLRTSNISGSASALLRATGELEKWALPARRKVTSSPPAVRFSRLNA